MLPVPTGASLLLAGETGEWTLVDLDTGAKRGVRMPSLDPYGAVAVRGGVVALGPDERAELIRFDGTPNVALGSAMQIVASGAPDRVWLVRPPRDGGGGPASQLVAVLLDLSGRQLAEVRVPQSYVMAGTRTGVMFGMGGQVFLAEPGGVRSFGAGEHLYANGEELVLMRCDDRARCGPAIVDLATGRSTPMTPPDTVPIAAIGAFLLSRDSVFYVVNGDGTSGRAVLRDRATGRTATGSANALMGPMEWLPGGLGVVATSPEGVVRLVVEGEELVARPLPGLGPDVRRERILVIPA